MATAEIIPYLELIEPPGGGRVARFAYPMFVSFPSRSFPFALRALLAVGLVSLVSLPVQAVTLLLDDQPEATLSTKVNRLPASLAGHSFIVKAEGEAVPFAAAAAGRLAALGMVAAPAGVRADYAVVLKGASDQLRAAHEADHGANYVTVADKDMAIPSHDTVDISTDRHAYFQVDVLDLTPPHAAKVYEGHIGFTVRLDGGRKLSPIVLSRLVSVFFRQFPDKADSVRDVDVPVSGS